MPDEGQPIESLDWLHAFGEGYLAAWNSHDPGAVTACATEDVVWVDPALPEPARGHEELADFVRSSCTAFPDLQFSEPAPPAITEDRLIAYAPWRMTGTNTGPIDPPGFAPTGKSVDIRGFDIWQFRDGLIWRYEAIYDFNLIARQLGLVPPPGGLAERMLVAAQRLRSRVPGGR
jgi:steroid delta-isomerase-like uncharacterized protein